MISALILRSRPISHEYTRTSLVRIHSIASAGFTAAAIIEKRFSKASRRSFPTSGGSSKKCFSSFGGSIFSVGTKDLFMLISPDKECWNPSALSGCPTRQLGRDADAPDGHIVVADRIAHAIVTEYGVAGGLVACAVGYSASLTWTVTDSEILWLRNRS